MIFSLVLLLILLIISFYCASSETALFSLSPMKVKAYRSDSDPKHRLIAHLLSQPRDLLVTVFMVNTVVNILIQNVFSNMVGIESSWFMRVWVPLIITLVFGEIIPKYIGLQSNITLANVFAPSINFLHNAIGPLRRFVVTVTAPISRALFFFLHKEPSISHDELQHVLKTSEEAGVLHADEAEMVWNFLSLQDANVREVMLPREDIIAYEINEPLTKLVHLFADKKMNDVAVYEQKIDNMIGTISAKRYFLHRDSIQKSSDLRQFLRTPYYVPENAAARFLLGRMEKQHLYIAIAVDEYGTNSGMVLKEHLFEQIIGEAGDTSDKNPHYTRTSPTEIIASGKLELSTFNEIFDCGLESNNNMVTIGGWLTEQMGDIPKTGAKFQTSDFYFQVLAADPNRIRRLYIRKIKS